MLLAISLLPLAGCQKFQARVELKKGNSFYQAENYRQALAQFQKGLDLDPGATFAWRSVGLAAMALYRPGLAGEDNARYADVAVDAFERYRRAYPDDPKIEEYLITVLIESERYDQALARLEEKARARPGDAAVERAIVTTLVRAGRLADALERAHRRGALADPQLLHTIGVAAWGKSYGDPALDLAARRAIVDLGLDATRRALDLEPDDFEAMAYYNLLCREKAKVTLDPIEQQRWYVEAEEWMGKAIALREAQQKEERAAAEGEGR